MGGGRFQQELRVSLEVTTQKTKKKNTQGGGSIKAIEKGAYFTKYQNTLLKASTGLRGIPCLQFLLFLPYFLNLGCSVLFFKPMLPIAV